MGRRGKKIELYEFQRVAIGPDSNVVELPPPQLIQHGLEGARLAKLERFSLWKPRVPGFRADLMAQLLRGNSREDDLVRYVSGGQVFEDTRQVFLTRYITRVEWEARENERRRLASGVR